MAMAQRLRADVVNEAAVARVIARYLSATGDMSGDESNHARALKDIVYRALSGKTITRTTLSWFIDAFVMERDDAEQLWFLFVGSDKTNVVSGELQPPPSAAAAFKPPKFQTVVLHDFHYLSSAGIPEKHRTVQVIRATEEGLDRYPYRFDTNTASVEVVRGGTSSSVYRVDQSIYAVDIIFPEPLRLGQTTSLEYITHFDYKEPPSPSFRRGATRRTENLSINVEFSSGKVPKRVWWGVWSDLRDDSPILMRETVNLTADLNVHRYVDAIDHTVVGFFWEW